MGGSCEEKQREGSGRERENRMGEEEFLSVVASRDEGCIECVVEKNQTCLAEGLRVEHIRPCRSARPSVH